MQAGKRINQYKIISAIGKGGMGEVFLAEDTKLDRKVALKILPSEFAKDRDRMARFVREAKSASALNHPSIITIYEIGESEGTHFIATEFIDGKTLNDDVKSNPLNYKSALEIAIQVASALDEAHQAGIVHRDIKPDNVMIRANGLAKILDFGIAKLTDRQGDAETRGHGEEDKTLIAASTNPGMIIGTANYMSPEQAKGKDIDARTDIFSFGVVLYEMIAGHLPFEGENALEMIGALLHKEQKPLSPEVPTEIAKIINKCLRKDRDERYQTIKDVLIDLKDTKQEMEFMVRVTPLGVKASGDHATEILSSSTTAKEITPQGVTLTSRYFAAGLLTLLLAVGGFFVYRYFTPTKRIESIAVMPFENKNSDADTEYLSDGLAESLIYRLSQLPDLKVSPTSSVFRYKGKESDPQTVAKELGVDSVMTGRITQRGENLTISVNLVDTRNGKSLWGEQYERKMSELLATQREIAGEITNKLQLQLSGAGEKVLTKQYTTNPEAYQLYLKGNFYRTKYTEEGYKKGLEYYEKAIAIDPNFALAYHGIASAYDFANGWYLPPKVAMPKEKAAALKALELDPTLAETHYLLGKVYFWYEWDWAAAEKQWKRANELDYSYPPTYPVYLAAMGRREEAIKAQEFVQQRLPLDLNVNLDSVGILLAAGRYDQSIEQNRKALELDPNFWWSHQLLGLAYERKKQYPEAIAALERARLAEANPSSLGYLGNVYAAAGKSAEAQKVLEELKELSKKRYVDPYTISCVYAGLGNKDQAFEWLERAYQERSFFMAILKNETVFDNLQSDPRFKDLLKRMNLPE